MKTKKAESRTLFFKKHITGLKLAHILSTLDNFISDDSCSEMMVIPKSLQHSQSSKSSKKTNLTQRTPGKYNRNTMVTHKDCLPSV